MFLITREFLALVLLRILNGFAVQTAFDPDEYWQGPEVAHALVFGYGHLTWEWLDPAFIRGFLHPLVFAIPFKVLHLLQLDLPNVVVRQAGLG